MKFDSELLTVNLKETFRTSRGEASEKVVCAVRLGDALGECCPSLHYGYSAEDCHSTIQSMDIEIPTGLFDLTEQLDLLASAFGDRRSLLAGLDIALHDLAARDENKPLHEYLGFPDPSGKESSYTISIDSPDTMQQRLEAAKDFRILKLKLGSEYDEENLKIVARQPGRIVRVDGNGAFAMDNIEWLIRAAFDYKLELIEEPLDGPSLTDLKELKRELNCPLVLDESIRCTDDIERFGDSISGINIKLQKVGGIRNAMRMIEVAKSMEMKLMIGCMLETSVGVAASANLCGVMDYIDLDSSYLLRDDPFNGMRLKDGKLVMPDRAGHGAIPK